MLGALIIEVRVAHWYYLLMRIVGVVLLLAVRLHLVSADRAVMEFERISLLLLSKALTMKGSK